MQTNAFYCRSIILSHSNSSFLLYHCASISGFWRTSSLWASFHNAQHDSMGLRPSLGRWHLGRFRQRAEPTNGYHGICAKVSRRNTVAACADTIFRPNSIIVLSGDRHEFACATIRDKVLEVSVSPLNQVGQIDRCAYWSIWPLLPLTVLPPDVRLCELDLLLYSWSTADGRCTRTTVSGLQERTNY